MLAYLFWHLPFVRIPPAHYEAALLDFHRDLVDSPPPGLKTCATYRISDVPWLAGRQVYEDWCFVESSAALDAINQAAVKPERWDIHADVARKMEVGYGGLYQHLYGNELAVAGSRAVWLTRPRGIRYEHPLQDIISGTPDFLSCWRRQMVLGPGYEFVVIGGATLKVTPPEGWRALPVERIFLGPAQPG